MARNQTTVSVLLLALACLGPVAHTHAQAAHSPAPRKPSDAGAAMAFGVDLGVMFHPGDDYDVFADSHSETRIGLFAGHDLLSLQPNLILAAQLAWSAESDRRTMDAFNSGASALAAEITAHNFSAGAELRYVWFAMLQPYARVAAGAAWVDASIDARTDKASEAAELRDAWTAEQWVPRGSFGLGLHLRTPTRTFEDALGEFASLSLGVLIECGYELSGPVSFERQEQNGNVTTVAAPIGDLSRSAPYLRLGLEARY